MRLVILIVLILLVFSLVGWITFSRQPGHSSINIETDQIRADADRAVESGSQLLKNAGQETDNRVSNKKEPAATVVDEPAPVSR